MREICNTLYIRLTAMVLSAVVLAFVSWSCVNDETADANVSLSGDLEFQAMEEKTISPATRSGELIPVNPDDFGDTVFYIYEWGAKKNDNKEEIPSAKVGDYWVGSMAMGQLDYKYNYDDKLNWFAADTKHRFWSWTWPLGERNYSDIDIDRRPDNEVLNFISSEFPSIDDEETSGTTAKIDLEEGEDPDDTEDPEEPKEPEEPEDPVISDLEKARAWNNGAILEQLVGARTERDYVFREDGRYVPLTYKHLVSKIILGSFVLVDNTGSRQEDLKARITFYGMPRRAMFYPLPTTTEKDKNGNDIAVAPYVTIDHTDPYGKTKDENVRTNENEAIAIQGTKTDKDGNQLPFDYDLNEYLTFYINNKPDDKDNNGGIIIDPDNPYRNRDVFYICPEVDFTELEYKVEFVEYDEKTNSWVQHHRYGNRGGYFGDFKTVNFEREVETAGDNGELTSEISTDRVLHAGEVMVLNMIVYEKSGPGAGVYIRSWNSQPLKSATHHNHKGIYSDGEATAVRSAFTSSSNNTEFNDAQKNAYEIYGEDEVITKDDGTVTTNKVIRLYSDITFQCANNSSNADLNYHFRLYPDNGNNKIILDGMGYTITFSEPASYHHEEHKTFTIGNMRDVYITNGTSTVYINPEGKICRINKETGKFVVSEAEEDVNWKPNTAIKFELES